MIGWIIIGILVVLGVFLVKFKEVRHRGGLFFLLFMAIFFVATMGHVYSKTQLDLSTFDGIVAACKVYFSWLGSVAHNIIQIGGYAIKQDWGVNVSSSGVNVSP